ncbi:universal stress protein [Lacinutrix sp. Hel_I_90]|uniref:universal stress protein n=1 Tax=Lacinutrix sp. Hel_I_90 TaxID=1249999 RepID=UPI0005C80139|nr:universal stress protein [Lacinutrix sp. Hel_I_90]
MKYNKYKILVLSDLKTSAESELKSTVSLAKLVDGEITLFHVKKPIDVVETDSQLSAMRSINEEHIITSKTIENLVQPICKEFGLHIECELALGNAKHEIENYINKYQPDIIVLGKRNPKKLNFIGDNLIDFVLKKHDGIIMIAAKQHALQPNQEFSLGVLNTTEHTNNTGVIEGLINKTKHPVRYFEISKNTNSTLKTETALGKGAIEFVFEQGAKAIDNVSKYASKNNINLMCVDTRNNDKASKTIKNVINKLNVSLLLVGKQKQMLHK